MIARNKVHIINAGINGNNTADLLARLDKDVFAHKPQLVILMVGTNDMLNIENMISYQEYEANYQKLLARLTEYTRVIMMTIPPVDPSSILRRVDPVMYSNIRPDVKVTEANKIVRKLALENKCSLIDLHNILQVCGGATEVPDSLFMNRANFDLEDGVHPTKQGYRVIGTAVYQAVSSLAPGIDRIVCLGDSITRGYKMLNEGTTEGDTYPAILKRMYHTVKNSI